MAKQYSEAFREQAVEKALKRGSSSIRSVAQALNVDNSTLRRWLRNTRQNTTEMMTSKRSSGWRTEDKLNALMETHALDAEQVNQYCREKGIFSHQLEAWREDFLRETDKPVSADKREIKSLKDEVKALNKELSRKEKALAETAALLVLRKKFDALLEEREK